MAREGVCSNHLTFGYIPGSGLFASALADYAADVANPFSGLAYGNAGAVRMENTMVEWMAGFIGYDVKEAAGCLV